MRPRLNTSILLRGLARDTGGPASRFLATELAVEARVRLTQLLLLLHRELDVPSPPADG